MGCILLETNAGNASDSFPALRSSRHRVAASLDSFFISASVPETDVGHETDCCNVNVLVSTSCKQKEHVGNHIRRVSAPLVVLQPDLSLLLPSVSKDKMGRELEIDEFPQILESEALPKLERRVQFSTVQVREHDLLLDETLSPSPLVVSDGLQMTLDWSYRDAPAIALPSLHCIASPPKSELNRGNSARSSSSKGLAPRTKLERWGKLKHGGGYTDRDLMRADRRRQILERQVFFGKGCAIYGKGGLGCF